MKKIDAIFAPWDTPDAPGCTVGVLEEGEMIFSRGYGMADLEHGVPITSQTVFNTGSVAKQFTAFAIHLLAQEGRLSLDDDIHKYLPELQDYGKPILLRHLLHHTSGMRDHGNLLLMAGWRNDDVIAEGDIIYLLSRQKELNFLPGEEELYSNSNYALLAFIVQRITGKSLRDFAQERIFLPLGMQRTLFRDDHGLLVKNRALSYQPQGPGVYRYVALSYRGTGSTNLYTTLEDFARWDRNFYDGRLGGDAVIAAMQTPGRLNNGKELAYASGLYWGEYRGLKTIEHGGSDAGYRANLLRFPEQSFSVALLCNSGDADPTALTRRVAEVFLDREFKSAPVEPLREIGARTAEVRLGPKTLDAYVGDYELGHRIFVSITRNDDRLAMEVIGDRAFSLVPSSKTNFFLKGANGEVIFDKPGNESTSMGFTMHQDDGDRRAKRIPHARPTAGQLQRYVGSFYSEELNTLYIVFARGGRLLVNHPRGINTMVPATMTSFVASFPIGAITYQCPERGPCRSFVVSNDRIRNLRFVRANLKTMTVPQILVGWDHVGPP